MNLVSDTKEALRKHMRGLLCHLAINKAHEAGIKVAEHIDSWFFSLNPSPLVVALFKNYKDEIDTAPLAAKLKNRGIVCCWPQIRSNKILELVPPHIPDIIIIPGLAFDKMGRRLGRGQGYYDRYLSGLDHKGLHPILVGLCLDEQLVEIVPTEKHDVVMNYICTPSSGVLKAGSE